MKFYEKNYANAKKRMDHGIPDLKYNMDTTIEFIGKVLRNLDKDLGVDSIKRNALSFL